MTVEESDKTGKIVIQPQFDDAEDFSDGLARVRTGTKSGFIDIIGKMVFETQWVIFNFFLKG